MIVARFLGQFLGSAVKQDLTLPVFDFLWILVWILDVAPDFSFFSVCEWRAFLAAYISI